ncbi:MAG: hypothetical protein C0456_13835 [Hyphomonas sp.]|uniref:hypothetical protein n=1 Tax=Hyphomonas sp. TaxID=87 RepID=UPI001DA19CB7|nr:hypothetical protein [Hyphomonas sp.]MBA4227704.1 hypothetical protein [Hyphomonas sp.]
MDALSTGQSGKIAEYFLACAVMSASGGRLSPFLPASDDHGVDLVVMDRLTHGCLGLQVKSWRASLGAERRTVQFDVRKATFNPTPRLALAMVVLDPETLTMEVGWLMPMQAVPSVSVEQADKFALTPSRSPASSDRYAGYRHTEIGSLIGGLIGMMPTSG